MVSIGIHDAGYDVMYAMYNCLVTSNILKCPCMAWKYGLSKWFKHMGTQINVDGLSPFSLSILQYVAANQSFSERSIFQTCTNPPWRFPKHEWSHGGFPAVVTMVVVNRYQVIASKVFPRGSLLISKVRNAATDERCFMARLTRNWGSLVLESLGWLK